MPSRLIKITTCPFCGGDDVKVMSDIFESRVKCYSCGTLGPIVIRRGDPIEAWNKRYNATLVNGNTMQQCPICGAVVECTGDTIAVHCEATDITEVTDDAVWGEDNAE